MQVVLDIKESYEAQFIGVLQSLDSRFFNKVEIDKDSLFMKNKAYLHKALESIDNGTAKMISLEEFEEKMDKVLSEYENKA